MKKVLIAVIVLAAAFVTVAMVTALNTSSKLFKSETPSKNIVSRELALGDFDEIDASRVDIEYTIGTPGKAILSAPDNVIDAINVDIRNGELKVSVDDRKNYNGKLNATLKVSSSSIKDIEAALSAHVDVKSPVITVEKLDLNASTSAEITIDSVVCEEADFVTKTSSEITVASLTCSDKAFLKASTSANLSVGKLCANKTEAESSTSASIRVNSGKTTKIDLDASTSSDIEMFADYDFGKADASTSGNINLSYDKLTERATSTRGRIRFK